MIATLDADAPVTTASKSLWTLEEYAARPKELYYHELVEGELVQKPMGAFAHLVISNLGQYVVPWAVRTGAGQFFTEAEFQYLPNRPRTVRIPDGVFLTSSRMMAYSWEDSFVRLVPDLAVEVVSPSDIFYDVDRKLAEFFEAGIPRVWIVNPDVPSVRVHRSFEDVVILRPGDELTDEEVLPGFRCPVATLFVRPGQPPVV